MKVRNTFAIFIVSGFWHGANWTFIVWGALNAIYFLPLLLLNKNRSNLGVIAQGKFLPGIREFLNMTLTFCLTVFAWIFFRAESVGHALSYISGIFSVELFTIPNNVFGFKGLRIVIFVILFIFIEWLGREKQHALQFDGVVVPKSVRWGIYYVLIAIIFFFSGTQQQFIYFQF